MPVTNAIEEDHELDVDAAVVGDRLIDSDLDRLSPREQEVLRHPARGYTYKEIARRLSILVKTVESYGSLVLRKLQLSNRHELSRRLLLRRIRGDVP